MEMWWLVFLTRVSVEHLAMEWVVDEQLVLVSQQWKVVVDEQLVLVSEQWKVAVDEQLVLVSQ